MASQLARALRPQPALAPVVRRRIAEQTTEIKKPVGGGT